MHQVDAVGSSLRVSGVCQDGAREFTRRRPRLTGRLLGVVEKPTGRLTMTGAMKLQPDDGPRSSLSIGPGLGRCSGISSKFTRRFAEGIRKLVRNTPGDPWKKIERLSIKMSKTTRLARVRSWFSLLVIKCCNH
ncbi:hypothetical protein BHM03_00052822 [Ensete ventricosum]|nr:hypothetical protein BHM03_00052822 [Ensete ventricosum]